MPNYLVTGYTGQDVTAALDAHKHAALVGASSYVATLGSQVAVSVVDANTIRLADGALFFQGLFACVPTGQYVDVAIESGTQGQNRNDLIGFRYTKNTTTGAELGEFVAIKGTPVTGTPSDPAYTEGDILNGDTSGFMPLYRVQISGITVGTPVALYNTAQPIASIQSKLDDLDDTESNTYTTDNNDFTGGVVDYGVVTVVKKAGWCIVHGSITPTDYVGSEWVEVLPPTVVPDTQHNSGVYTTAHYWGATYNQPLRVGVRGDGSLIIAYGSANKYTFAITYPIE